MSLIRKDSIEACQALNELNYVIEDWAARNAVKLRRSCGSCMYAVRTGPFRCSLYGVTPPIDVILDGCNEYSGFDPLPF